MLLAAFVAVEQRVAHRMPDLSLFANRPFSAAAGILATARNAGTAPGAGLAGAIFTTGPAQGEPGGSVGALFGAISTAFLVIAGFARLGGVTSWVRGAEALS